MKARYMLMALLSMALVDGCRQQTPPTAAKHDAKADSSEKGDPEGNRKITPASGEQKVTLSTESEAVSGWSMKAPTVTPLEGEFKQKTSDFEEDRLNKVHLIPPTSGNRLARFDCRFTAVVEDARALDTFSERRKAAFQTVQDKAFLFLNGDGSLGPQFRKEKLTGKYRVFDMERLVLVDPTKKGHKPVWCIAPRANHTFIYTPQADADTDLMTYWVESAKFLPDPMTLSLRTNACRQLKTGGMLLALIELDQPVDFSLLYQIPKSVNLEDLQLVVDGAGPAPVKLKK